MQLELKGGQHQHGYIPSLATIVRVPSIVGCVAMLSTSFNEFRLREVGDAQSMAHLAQSASYWERILEDNMNTSDTVVAVFPNHEGAETAVKKLASEGFNLKDLSVVGKGYHTDEKVVGFYNVGDRMKFWGTQGAFWGGLWGLFFGGLFLTIPIVGHVVVLGYLAGAAITAVESAVMTGGVSALGAALYSIGIPKNSVLEYESAIKADGFLVMAHGTTEEMARARSILGILGPSHINLHVGLDKPLPAEDLTHAAE